MIFVYRVFHKESAILQDKNSIGSICTGRAVAGFAGCTPAVNLGFYIVFPRLCLSRVACTSQSRISNSTKVILNLLQSVHSSRIGLVTPDIRLEQASGVFTVYSLSAPNLEFSLTTVQSSNTKNHQQNISSKVLTYSLIGFNH